MKSLPAEYQAESVDIWVGPGKHAVTYPLRGGELMNLVACVEQQDRDEESWVTKRPWQELYNDFRGWHGAIEAIIEAADHDECYRWAMNNRQPVENWSLGRVTLLGDAAHPTLPYMAQGAAMAVEDAAVITRAIQESVTAEEAVQLYQRNRIDRTARIVNESSDNRRLFHLDSVTALRAAFAERDMKAERTAWLFSYDPTSVALV
jgi:salicylate hydroxylase